MAVERFYRRKVTELHAREIRLRPGSDVTTSVTPLLSVKSTLD